MAETHRRFLYNKIDDKDGEEMEELETSGKCDTQAETSQGRSKEGQKKYYQLLVDNMKDINMIILSSAINFTAMLLLTWASASAVSRDALLATPTGDTRINDGIISSLTIFMMYAYLPQMTFHHALQFGRWFNRFLRAETWMEYPWLKSVIEYGITCGTLATGAIVGAKINTMISQDVVKGSGTYTNLDGISYWSLVSYSIPFPFFFYLVYTQLRTRTNSKFMQLPHKYSEKDVATAQIHIPFLLAVIVWIELLAIGEVNGESIFLFRSLGSSVISGNYGGLMCKFIGSTIGYFAAMVFEGVRYKYCKSYLYSIPKTERNAMETDMY